MKHKILHKRKKNFIPLQSEISVIIMLKGIKLFYLIKGKDDEVLS